jgi:hypothetical protein
VPEGFPLLSGVPAKDVDTERRTFRDLGRSHLIDPCHNNDAAAVEPGRTDLLQVTHTGPAYAYSRELVVYEDSSAANEAMLLIAGELERCPVFRYDDGVSTDRWEPSPALDEDLRADDLLASVNHGYTDDMPTTLATHWVVARVGNAVLTMAADGEFGASPSGVRATAGDEADAYRKIAEAMCPFADESTDIGCSGEAAGPGEVVDPGPETLLDEATLRDVTGVREFETTPDAQTATLACQGDWLAALGPDADDYRQFEARVADHSLAAWAGTAVLGFADPAAARAAYDTVTRQWLESCSPQVDPTHRLVAAVDSGLGPPHSGDTPQGPYLWRGVKLTAPERCVECDAAWDDHQGAVLAGRELVLVHVAFGGDMQLGVDDSRSPLDELLPLLAKRAQLVAGTTPSRSRTLGAEGYGALRLGMSIDAAERTGAVRLLPGTGQCTGFQLGDHPPRRHTTDGYADDALGLMAIFARKGMSTPEGVALGATKREARAAYPDAEQGVAGWSAPVPGHPDRVYELGFESGRLVSLALALDAQTCYG